MLTSRTFTVTTVPSKIRCIATCQVLMLWQLWQIAAVTFFWSMIENCYTWRKLSRLGAEYRPCYLTILQDVCVCASFDRISSLTYAYCMFSEQLSKANRCTTISHKQSTISPKSSRAISRDWTKRSTDSAASTPAASSTVLKGTPLEVRTEGVV